MTLEPLQCSKYEAMDKADEYQKAIADGRAFPGDEDLAVAYRAMAKGKVVIDLHTALIDAGMDSDKRPNLAICRADAKVCRFFRCMKDDGTWRWSFSMDDRWHKPVSRRHIDVPFSIYRGANHETDIQAYVPTIPPQCRPKDDLDRYHILWEAEWQPHIPKDPYLLKQLSGSFYAILAHWDLTPLEQAVLRNRVMP